jgi:hypothetical protein
MAGADRVSIIPAGNGNRPGYRLKAGRPEFITIHETANTALGANAEMHRRFVHNGGGTEGVSFHYVVDEDESIQLLPDNEVAWHAGDGRLGDGNNRSVGIEVCVNRGADWAKTMANLTGLVKALQAEFNIPVYNIKQHHDFSSYRKNCPTNMRANEGAGWRAFIAGLQEPQPEPPPKPALEAYWEANGGVARFGHWLEPDERTMVLEDGNTYQVRFCERALLHWRPGDEVGEALVGKMLLHALVRLGEI